MNKGTKKAIHAGIMVSTLGLCSSVQADLLAYEGFDTDALVGSDFSNVGVTGSGFSATTTDQTDYRMDFQTGLSYSDGVGNTLVSTGHSVGLTTVTAGTQNFQLALNSPIVNSGTVYMSFILDVSAVTSWGVMSGLEDSVISRSAGPSSSLEAVFRSTSSNYGIASHDGSSWDLDQRTGPATAPGTFFVVSEMDMDAEVMTTWLNPNDLTDVPGTAANTLSGSPSSTWQDMTHFIFSLGGEEAGTIDEIRIGTTIGDVTPVPEPGAIALALGMASLAGVLLRRRLRG